MPCGRRDGRIRAPQQPRRRRTSSSNELHEDPEVVAGTIGTNGMTVAAMPPPTRYPQGLGNLS